MRARRQADPTAGPATSTSTVPAKHRGCSIDPRAFSYESRAIAFCPETFRPTSSWSGAGTSLAPSRLASDPFPSDRHPLRADLLEQSLCSRREPVRGWPSHRTHSRRRETPMQEHRARSWSGREAIAIDAAGPSKRSSTTWCKTTWRHSTLRSKRDSSARRFQTSFALSSSGSSIAACSARAPHFRSASPTHRGALRLPTLSRPKCEANP